MTPKRTIQATIENVGYHQGDSPLGSTGWLNGSWVPK